MDLASLSLATFEPLVGDAFTIRIAPAPIELVLQAADALGARPRGREPFRLEYLGPGEPQLAQSIYRLEHSALGAHEIFIVPIGRDDAGVRYEAIFT